MWEYRADKVLCRILLRLDQVRFLPQQSVQLRLQHLEFAFGGFGLGWGIGFSPTPQTSQGAVGLCLGPYGGRVSDVCSP